MGKKPIVSVTYENERISIKKKTAYLTYNVCYVSPVWSTGRFMADLLAPTAPIASKLRLGNTR